ncbi:hypothetical protein Hsero_1585 [Herbaspirillum seropedicae SmR1]|uniref:Uncharacterized protein n=1 Tax=Herbaspirillum seropedicae (strain SmR1) TaxID=757424 RepID=D8IQ52_HERSS|nr:hypothetical protein Hsero_1585 [Herbaspirillum seropedicae SmR1]
MDVTGFQYVRSHAGWLIRFSSMHWRNNSFASLAGMANLIAQTFP